MQFVELDCEPFAPRPDLFLALAIEGTDLCPTEASSKLFGCWRFEYNDVPSEMWRSIQPVLKQNITRLYEEGKIRYGSWGSSADV